MDLFLFLWTNDYLFCVHREDTVYQEISNKKHFLEIVKFAPKYDDAVLAKHLAESHGIETYLSL